MQTPFISFIIVAGSDDSALESTLRSFLGQSLAQVEIVCVHRGERPTVAAEITADSRTVFLSARAGSTKAQARRIAVGATSAPYMFFSEPGDTAPTAFALNLHRSAESSSADIIGFADSPITGSTQDSMPTTALEGPDLLRSLVPRENAAPLDAHGLMLRTALLRKVYAAVAPGASPLIDDRSIVLLALTYADSYAFAGSLGYMRRGRVDRTRFEVAVEHVAAFRRVEPIIRERARTSSDPEPILDAYAAGYLTVVVDALGVFASLSADERDLETPHLQNDLDELDTVAAAVTLAPELLPLLATYGRRRELGHSPVRSVLLTTNVLTTGGVSGVLLTQARFLLDAGYRVTIATHRSGSAESLAPEGVELVQLTGTSLQQRARQWARLCIRNDVDVVIDHRILYSRDWPVFALAARAVDAATIGWIHNFAGRPTYNGNELQTLLSANLGALAHLVVLSLLDVAFWKLRGIDHVSYLPNPPSPFLLGTGRMEMGKPAPVGRPIELVWWGRLEEHTKKVSQLIEIAAELQRLRCDFRLRIVGPDWAEMSADRLRDLAAQRGVSERVELTGPLHGSDLLDVIDSTDVFVNASIIEGYPLTLPEAQSRGLPVVMYDLPWLSLIQDNAGVVTTPQQDPRALAEELAELAADGERYEAMSRASIAAAARASSHDFAALYEALLHGDLPAEYSPAPTVEDGSRALELLIFFAEHSTPPPRAASARRPRTESAANGRAPRTLRERVERKLTPVGHRVVDAAPWLRPAAARVKHLLLRR